ncbi:MAG: hypothetical protein V2A58_07275 [Planctomycetota bacterium]
MAFMRRALASMIPLLAFFAAAAPLGAADPAIPHLPGSRDRGTEGPALPGAPFVVGEPAAFVDWSLLALGVRVEVQAPDADVVARGLRRAFRETPEAYEKRVQDERRLRARAAAVEAAKEAALPLLLAMPLDSTRTVADLQIQDPLPALLGPKTRVDVLREIWNERLPQLQDASLQVDAQIPIWDGTDESIGAKLLKIIEPQFGEPPETLRRMREARPRLREGEMFVFDARSVPARPVLFPRVVTDEGEVIYNALALRRKLLLERGPGSYSLLDQAAVIPIPHSRDASLPLVWVLPVKSVSDPATAGPAAYVVSAAEAKAFLADTRRLAALLSGRIRFLLPKTE